MRKLLQGRNLLLVSILAIAQMTVMEVVRAEEAKEAGEAGEEMPLQLGNASDLLAQGVTRVTGVEVIQTKEGIELVLETVARSERLVPLIVPEGNNLVIDILDATLALELRNGVTEVNPAPGISRVTVNPGDDNSIQVRITGENQTPSAKIVTGRDNLVLSIDPERIAEESNEEIDIIATGQGAEDDYYVPNASTATGTDTQIIETPFSAQVVPQEVLREQQVVRIEEALNNVSGVSFAGSTSSREANFNIRGFGNADNGGAPILRDGYRLYGSFQAIPEIANLEQVEVLKGPSAILYGQIQPGGIINYVSKQPLDRELTEVELQVGNREFIRPRFDLNFPTSEDNPVALRINGTFQHEESFRNYNTDTNQYSLAPVFKWEIGDRTDLTFNVEYIHREAPADFGISRFGDGVAPVDRDFMTNNPDDSLDTDYVSTGYSFEHRFNDNWKIRNGFRFIDYGYNFSVVAIPIVFDGENVTRFFADQDGKDRSFSLSTNTVGEFNTGSVEHTLTAGIDLNRSESNLLTLLDNNPLVINIFDPDYDAVPKPDRSTLPLFGDVDDISERLGIYLQDQVKLLDNVILVAGLRYDTISQTTTNAATNSAPASETEKTNDAFTPRVGLLYRPIPALSLFANYSQSFEPNDDFTVDGEALDPEEGEGFEVGIKTETANKKLLATLTYFDITKQNVAVTNPNNTLFSIPIGEQSSQGVELDVSGEILPGWKIIASYAYIDATVTDDVDETIVGNRLFGVPENKANLWTTYEIQTGSLAGLGFGLGVEYVDNRFGDLDNSYTIGDYTIGNAAIFYEQDKYRLAVNFKNFTDAEYFTAAIGNDGGIEPGFPFTVIGSLSYQF